MVYPRSLEMLEAIGVLDELIDSGVRTTALEMNPAGGKPFRIEFGSVDSAFPYSIMTAQKETERILTGALARHGVTVERESELTGLTQDESGVRVLIRLSDGSVQTATAPYLVGADGARSAVRHLLGTALEGDFHGERFLVGDVDAEHGFDPHTMYTFFSPHDGLLMVFPMKGNRVRLIAQVSNTEDAPATEQWLQRVTDERSGARLSITYARWLTTFDIRHAQVPQYRHGRVFLAGAAAHVHSPAGAQGMNTGIQDAFNLGWKLALCVTGAAGSKLLDSYHAERHPVGAHVISFTTKMTKAATLSHPVAQRIRDGAMHAATVLAPVQHAIAQTAEETGIEYHGSPAVVPGGLKSKLVPGDHLPDALPELRTALAAETSHVLVTVAAPVAAELTGALGAVTRQLLVAAGTTGIPAESGTAYGSHGYAITIADPQGLAVTRFGLARGGRILVRPDGYVAALASLTDDVSLHAYEAVLTDWPARS